MKVKEVLDRTIQFFNEKKFESPRLDAELLIAGALGFQRIDLYLKFDQPLKEEELTRCRDHVRRRSIGEPVAYILQKKDFYGETFLVNSHVLIPRPETELLVEEGERLLKELGSQEKLQVLDLGCGSGCIGLSLAKKIENLKVTLLDLSQDSIGVAKLNAEQLGIESRCELICADAGQVTFSENAFDLILANPPYIASDDSRVDSEVVKFEPHAALFAEDDGLAFIFEWSRRGLGFLKPGAWMGFEIGNLQGERTQKHFQDLGLRNVHIVKDLAGHSRHVFGQKPPLEG